jgi:hypothetical protein
MFLRRERTMSFLLRLLQGIGCFFCDFLLRIILSSCFAIINNLYRICKWRREAIDQ